MDILNAGKDTAEDTVKQPEHTEAQPEHTEAQPEHTEAQPEHTEAQPEHEAEPQTDLQTNTEVSE